MFDFKTHLFSPLFSSIYVSSSCSSALSHALQQPRSQILHHLPCPRGWPAHPSESCSCLWSPKPQQFGEKAGLGLGVDSVTGQPQATIVHTGMNERIILHIVPWRHDHKACIYVLFCYSCCGKSDVLNISSP